MVLYHRQSGNANEVGRKGVAMLKVVDSWTTQDGEWFASSKPYSIDVEHVGLHNDIPGKGAAHHIFVRVPMGAEVLEFNTEDGQNKTEWLISQGNNNRWYSFPIFQSYDPTTQQGAWLVRIDGEKVAEGIGLPHGWHVSHFLIVEDVKPEVPVPEPGTVDKYQLFKNGVEVWSS
jgi:hypothetical protein